MNCPVCDATVLASDLECGGCRESLVPWNTMRKGGEALRQRGLAAAALKDYVGALASFLQAALTNPFDERSMLDAARALVHLNRAEDADRVLTIAASRPGLKETAEAMRLELRRRAEKDATAVAVNGAPAPEAGAPVVLEVTEAAPEPAEEATPRLRPLLAMGQCTAGTFFRRAPLPPWPRILQREQQADLDWTGVPVPVAEVIGTVKDNRPAINYMLGLGYWQARDRDGALRAFRRCIDEKPPVLNPYAYWICLHLEGDGEKLRQALAELNGRKWLGKDLPACLEAIERHLEGRDEPALTKALRQARTWRL
jgi:tetratricopeptide (TPR) repeat protein